MPAVSEDLVRELAVISQARALTWATRGPYDAATLPIEDADDADAVDLSLALGTRTATKAFVRIQLREAGWSKTSRNDIGVFDGSSTYRATINGTNYDDTAGTTEAEALGNLATAISAGIHPVAATVEDGQLVVRGETEADFTAAYSVVGGTGTWTSGSAGLTDATTVEWRAWGIAIGKDVPDVLDGMEAREETGNAIHEVSTRGLAHLGIQIVSTDGLVTVEVGIADLES